LIVPELLQEIDCRSYRIPRVSLSYDSEIPNPMADSAGHRERIAYRPHKEGSNRRSLWVAAGEVPA